MSGFNLLLIQYIIIGLLFAYLIGFMFQTKIEHFTNNSIFLFGDSILQNESYVAQNRDVISYLPKTVQNYAEDGAVINDIQMQIKQAKSTKIIPRAICLSIGGNDILKSNKIDIDGIFENYLICLKLIKTEFPTSELFLINLYIPPKFKQTKMVDVISAWNNKLKTGPNKIIDISTVLTDDNDFVFDIEPSESGGFKIATAILSAINI